MLCVGEVIIIIDTRLYGGTFEPRKVKYSQMLQILFTLLYYHVLLLKAVWLVLMADGFIPRSCH